MRKERLEVQSAVQFTLRPWAKKKWVEWVRRVKKKRTEISLTDINHSVFRRPQTHYHQITE